MHVIRSLFQLSGLEDERFNMKQLLARIPEINKVLAFQRKPNPIVKQPSKTGSFGCQARRPMLTICRQSVSSNMSNTI